MLGGICAVHQFVRIGRYCMISGGTMAGLDVPPFCTAQGDRAALRGLNLLGMRRAGLGREAVSAVKAAYKTLFMSGLTQAAALERLKGSGPVPEVQEMIRFIEASKRGITRPAAGDEGKEEEAG